MKQIKQTFVSEYSEDKTKINFLYVLHAGENKYVYSTGDIKSTDMTEYGKDSITKMLQNMFRYSDEIINEDKEI
jgi:hypothetical protein